MLIGRNYGFQSNNDGKFFAYDATAGVNRITLDSSGKVGVGLTPTSATLEVSGQNVYTSSANSLATATTKAAFRVKGATNSSDGLWMGVETSNAEPYIQGANGVGNNAKDLLLNPFGGDVGIGTTSPTTSLHIQGANTTGKGQLVVSSASAGQEARMTFIDGSDDIAEISTNGDHLYFYNERSSGAFQFYTGGNERARLDSNGRLLIGTTTEGEHTADDLTVATSGDTGISIRSGTSSSGRLFLVMARQVPTSIEVLSSIRTLTTPCCLARMQLSGCELIALALSV